MSRIQIFSLSYTSSGLSALSGRFSLHQVADLPTKYWP
ncbi:MAG: hypothetical protein FJY16_06575 [Bacteroidetes bacterium]|nr:hypothetical protein [Bacteroidota bacterium]